MRRIDIPDFIKGLIFDCDGTLVDSMPLHLKAWEHVILSQGGLWASDFFISVSGMPEADIVVLYNQQFGQALDPVETIVAKHTFFRSHASEFKPIRHVLDVVRRYHLSLPMAVVSGGVRDIVELELDALGIKDCFETILTADDDIKPKPAPDIFLAAARRLAVPPERCQVFEDGELGLEGARLAGMLATDVR